MQKKVCRSGIVQVMLIQSLENIFSRVAKQLNMLDDGFFENYIFLKKLLLVEISKENIIWW